MLVYEHGGCQVRQTRGRNQAYALWVPTRGDEYAPRAPLALWLFTGDVAEAKQKARDAVARWAA